MRGNLDTRLAKLDRGEYAGIILAAAGLQRLGLSVRIKDFLESSESLPAAGQGALGIEICEDRSDMRAWLAPLSCPATTACVLAERAVSRVLGGSCQVPLAAYATLDGGLIDIRALVASPDGQRVIRARHTGPAIETERAGELVAQELLSNGAKAILADLLEN